MRGGGAGEGWGRGEAVEISSHPGLLILRTKKAATYVLVAEEIEKPYLV